MCRLPHSHGSTVWLYGKHCYDAGEKAYMLVVQGSSAGERLSASDRRPLYLILGQGDQPSSRRSAIYLAGGIISSSRQSNSSIYSFFREAATMMSNPSPITAGIHCGMPPGSESGSGSGSRPEKWQLESRCSFSLLCTKLYVNFVLVL